MKRSAINSEIRGAQRLLEARAFYLPAFASWSPEQWRRAGPECRGIVDSRLGWDVSDFGGGDFDRLGAVLFTIRNGNLRSSRPGTPYAEKIIILRPEQRLPLHLHWSKTEDIINRGGGLLVMELFAAREDGGMDRASPVTVYCDGREVVADPGAHVLLGAGESMTLRPRMYHRFWADGSGGTVLAGEVSTVNDDETDNLFVEPISRFADIEEDEPAAFVLCNEYETFVRFP